MRRFRGINVKTDEYGKSLLRIDIPYGGMVYFAPL